MTMSDAETAVEHEHEPERGDLEVRGRLAFALGLTGLVLVAEVVGGVLSGSLALLSDAGHVFMDLLALFLSWFALRLAALPPTETRTYGWHRTEVLAALLNGITLFVIAAGIFYEAVSRFTHPAPVHAGLMLAVAVAGLVVNAVVALRLRTHGHGDLNLRSAYLHVLGDLLASVGVVGAGAIIALTGWTPADPIVSVVIGALILVGSGRLVRESVHILLEGVPRGVDINEVAAVIRAVDGVGDVHHLHIWSICSDLLALSGHVVIGSEANARREAVLNDINFALRQRFSITDTTLQFDCPECRLPTLIPQSQHYRAPKTEHRH